MNRFSEHILSIFINIFTLGHYGFIYVGTHHDMCRWHNIVVKKATFKEFKDAYYTQKWETHGTWKKSLFGIGDISFKNWLHADVMRIDDVGYLLTSYGYIMANRFIKQQVKQINNERNNKCSCKILSIRRLGIHTHYEIETSRGKKFIVYTTTKDMITYFSVSSNEDNINIPKMMHHHKDSEHFYEDNKSPLISIDRVIELLTNN